MDDRALVYAYQARRQAAEAALRRRKAHIYGQHPKLQRIENELTHHHARFCLAQGKAEEVERLGERILDLKQQRLDYLHKHEIPEDFDRLHYHCSLCKDRGYTAHGPCACREALQAELYHWPEEEREIEGAYFESFDLQRYTGVAQMHMKDIVEWLKLEVQHFQDERQAQNLFFTGQAGTGKTFLAGALLHTLRARGIPSLFVVAPTLQTYYQRQETLRQSYDPNPEDLDHVQTRLHLLETLPFVVVDDLGSETVMHQALLYFLKQRKQKGLWTCITSNLTLDRIQARYDERVSSRIGGDYLTLRFEGEDQRKYGRYT